MNLELKKGIYKIVNKIDKRFYYGSAAHSFKKRWREHINDFKAGRHGNGLLQNAWNEFGNDAFEFEIIEILEQGNLTKKEFKKILLQREQGYLDIYFDDAIFCYNLCPFAGNKLGSVVSEQGRKNISAGRMGKGIGNTNKLNKKESEETRRRKSEAGKIKQFSPEHKKHISEGQLGRKHSPETREKISQSKIGKKQSIERRIKQGMANSGSNNPMYGKKHTEETKNKISAAAKNRNKKK